ncbi:MAG: iron ABC transporter permease [Candidatus Omnitrophica bacterium]|nr:iron ABC transporter permease [Candidatus Omnitrophota bacterium]
MKARSVKVKIVFLFLGLLIAACIGISQGASGIPLAELTLAENRPILYLRILRVAMAAITGCGLAVSGIALQAVLRNALAEPYLLGTSSGAGLGAVIAVIAGVSAVFLPLAAFCGAVLSIILVYFLSREHNKIAAHTLVLSGVIVSVALSAVIVFLISISGEEKLHGMTWWLWGSFQVYDIRLLAAVSLIVLCGVAGIFAFSQDLNAICIGEEEATHLGIDTETVKKALLLLVSLITASLVCVCGIIGFAGLIIPHMMRIFIGSNHKTLIPATCVAAAAFMILCDALSRLIMPPLEIPIGVITAVVGAPLFIFLLKQKQKI